MLKWLRDTLMKGDEETFNIGLERNTNFLEFAKSFSFCLNFKNFI